VRSPGSSAAVTADVELDRLVLVGDLHLQRARLLGEQARPRVAAADRLLGDDLLLRLREQVRPVAADVAQVVAASLEAIRGEQLLGSLVVERGPLELEEQELGLDRRRLLVDARDERPVRRVVRVDREAQVCVVGRSADQIADDIELVHRVRELGAFEVLDAAGVALRERGGALVGFRQHAVDARLALAFDKGLEVPGDVLKIGHAHHPNVTQGRAEATIIPILRLLAAPSLTSPGGRE
jgi:hypothetical protein